MGFQRTVQKVWRPAREHGARIIFAHDFEPMAWIKAASERYA